MKNSGFTLRKIASLLAMSVLVAGSPFASAVSVNGFVSTIEQFGSGSAFHHGLTVSAWTNYSTLTAGGTYVAQCAHPATLPVSGERQFSGTSLGVNRNSLVVTVPQNLPALSNITGWSQVGAETELACNYRWTAFAQESGFSIGAGGVTFPVGNGIARDGGTVDFTMYRGLTGAGGGGCGP